MTTRLLTVLVVCGATAAAADPKPNIVMVITDDLGWNTAWNNDDIISPTLNALAKDGMIMDRHYVYRYCAPTRGSFLTGRYPYRLSATRANLIPWSLPDGINTTYKYLPKKLKEAGYATHHIGKWHNGFVEYAMTPPGRGFDTSLGFLVGGEDHWTSQAGGECNGVKVVDLSYGFSQNQSVFPAIGLNGTYTGHIFSDRAVSVISEHDAATPLFMYVALHNTHAPIEAPPEYVAMYNFNWSRQNNFDAQVTFVDHTVKNITDALHQTQLWANTLFVWTTDNGSPPSVAGSNDPLRGGKGSFWDGGYRVPGFINGGLVPTSKRGTHLTGVIHVCDWWPTFASLAGLPPTDTSGPAPLDGHDQSAYILGTAPTSPRTEVVLDHLMHCVPPGDTSQCVRGQTPDFPEGHYPNHTAGALLSITDGKIYKLIVGPAAQATWYGHFSPNASSGKIDYDANVGCWPNPCLFELAGDETEHTDLSTTEPSILSTMLARFKALEATYHPPKTNPPDDEAGLCRAVAATGGFMHPWR